MTLREIKNYFITFDDTTMHSCQSSLPLLEVLLGMCREKKKFICNITKFEVTK